MQFNGTKPGGVAGSPLNPKAPSKGKERQKENKQMDPMLKETDDGCSEQI